MSIVFRYYTEICEFSILCPTTQKKIAQNNKKIVSKSSAHVSIYELHCFLQSFRQKKFFFVILLQIISQSYHHRMNHTELMTIYIASAIANCH